MLCNNYMAPVVLADRYAWVLRCRKVHIISASLTRRT